MATMNGCRLILAVYGPEGICYPGGGPRVGGAPLHAELTARVHELLARHGVRVLRSETVDSEACFTLILSAEVEHCAAQTLKDLRSRLEADARPLGVRVRVQREEIFAYMHRI